jgi:uncharacterized protein YecE (DUF72 family)
MYWSRYNIAFVDRLPEKMTRRPRTGDVWCAFDKTAAGAALENAWELRCHTLR